MAAPVTSSASSAAQRRFGRIVVTLVSFGYIVVVGTAIAAAAVVLRARSQSAWVSHTYEVESTIETIGRQSGTMRTEAVVAAYLHRPLAASFYNARTALRRSIEHLAELTADNPRQQARIPRLRETYRDFGTLLDSRADRGFAAWLTTLDAADGRMRPLLADLKAEEERLLLIRREALRMNARSFWIVMPMNGVLLLIVGIASVVTIRRFTGDLARSRDELATANEGLEGAVQVRTRDLLRANEEIQRFAYIVSHDLRAPLVNVMGFTAELDTARKQLETLVERAEAEAPAIVTDEARLAVREDLPEAIGFIRGSTQKMDRLINAILRLSREGRRTLASETLDTGAIVQGAIDSMRHRIDALGVDVSIEGALPAIATDRLAFEQIMTNLIENAVKYLKPGRPGVVRIGGSAQLGRVTFEVVDNGRGVEPRDHERIFDLFRRAGTQDQPGEGIGLAHVRALAHRLGGTVDVRSELDKGATFSVNLPARFAGEKDKPA